MKTLKKALVLLAAGAMVTPALSAQSARTNGSVAMTQNIQLTTADSPAATLVNVDSSTLKAVNRKIEVGGVWLGMPADAAQTAVLKRNPKFAAEPHHFGFAETPNTLFTDSIAFQVRNPTSYAQGDTGMSMGLVLQPMPSAVATIVRHLEYDETNAPTIAATIQALLAKYGPASMVLPKDATDRTQYLWIFDGSGKLVKTTNAYGFPAGCAQLVPSSVLTLLRDPGHVSIAASNCATYTTLQAEVYEWNSSRKLRNGQTMPPGVLFQLTVTAISYPLLNESANATRNMLVAARNGEQQQKKNALKKNAPVL